MRRRATRKGDPVKDYCAVVRCDYCGERATLERGDRVYPHLPKADFASKRFYVCWSCQAWVGTHADGAPLGRLAKADLRKARMDAHRAFDELWRSGRMTRDEAYAWLARVLGKKKSETHIGHFDVAGCRAVVDAVMYLEQDGYVAFGREHKDPQAKRKSWRAWRTKDR